MHRRMGCPEASARNASVAARTPTPAATPERPCHMRRLRVCGQMSVAADLASIAGRNGYVIVTLRAF